MNLKSESADNVRYFLAPRRTNLCQHMAGDAGRCLVVDLSTSAISAANMRVVNLGDHPISFCRFAGLNSIFRDINDIEKQFPGDYVGKSVCSGICLVYDVCEPIIQ